VAWVCSVQVVQPLFVAMRVRGLLVLTLLSTGSLVTVQERVGLSSSTESWASTMISHSIGRSGRRCYGRRSLGLSRSHGSRRFGWSRHSSGFRSRRSIGVSGWGHSTVTGHATGHARYYGASSHTTSGGFGYFRHSSNGYGSSVLTSGGFGHSGASNHSIFGGSVSFGNWTNVAGSTSEGVSAVFAQANSSASSQLTSGVSGNVSSLHSSFSFGVYRPVPCVNFAPALQSLGVIISESNNVLLTGMQESLARFKCKCATSARGTHKLRIRLPDRAHFYYSEDNGNTVRRVSRLNDIRLTRNEPSLLRHAGSTLSVGGYRRVPCAKFSAALQSLGILVSMSKHTLGVASPESLVSFKCKCATSAGGTHKLRIRLPGHAKFYCSRDNGNTVQTVTRVNDIRLTRNEPISLGY